MIYTIEWTCENEVESVDGTKLPEDYFDGLNLSEPYKPLKRTKAITTCGGVTKIKASSPEAALAQMHKVLRGPRIVRLA